MFLPHNIFISYEKKKYIYLWGAVEGGRVKNEALFSFLENERREQKLAVRSLVNRFFSYKNSRARNLGACTAG